MPRQDQGLARHVGREHVRVSGRRTAGLQAGVRDRQRAKNIATATAANAKLPISSNQSPLFGTRPLLQFPHDRFRFHLLRFEIEDQLRIVEDRGINVH